ncbi:hypothetical protein F442_10072 [Phytophthora nicotianae P10297]|uniref:Uncharacterized protein n=1 Tax=Phytophthora nicotianae P10297 TaxID=1317064 RepID=W2ZA43_PHYNI|nr:hypothetical protein F442_10072 [Phytophthora nicotianae P10297]
MASCTLEKVTQGGELGEIHQQPIYDGHVRIELHMACPKLAAFIAAHRERQDVSFVAGGSVHSSRKARGFLNFAADVRHSKLSAAALRLEFVKLKSRKGIRPPTTCKCMYCRVQVMKPSDVSGRQLITTMGDGGRLPPTAHSSKIDQSALYGRARASPTAAS